MPDDVDLPDPAGLAPIEVEFWTEGGTVPAEASIVVRGAPIAPEKFLSHAARQAREYSLRGNNMVSVSVDLVIPDWPLDRILAEQLGTYSRFATCQVVDVQAAGFELLATGEPPHGDVVLPSLSILEATRLSELFAVRVQRNPHKRRR